MDDRLFISATRKPSSEITRVNFTTLRKGGLDPNEVRLHLEAAAREMGHLENRIRELQEQLAEAQRRADNPTFDEATLATALGPAERFDSALGARRGRSRHRRGPRAQRPGASPRPNSAAPTHLIEAQERATALITEAENTATQIDHDARLAAERLIDSAKVNGEALIEHAREQGRAIVEQSNEARRTVLNDLAIKRKALHLQIDQLRAARDTLGSFVATLRQQVDDVLAGINSSDEAGARGGARSAARHIRHARTDRRGAARGHAAARGRRSRAGVGRPRRGAERAPTATRSRTGEASDRQDRGEVQDAEGETLLEDDPSGTDVVNEIFARLRKATLEERGATALGPKKAAAHKPETPVGVLFRHRDEALEESLSVLTRRVKRVLQDDQNIMLERTRNVKAMITDELEDELVQRARYAEAANEALDLPAKAGVQFAREEGGVAITDVDASLDR